MSLVKDVWATKFAYDTYGGIYDVEVGYTKVIRNWSHIGGV